MKLSVIIPCYNVEKYVEQCVRSVMDSTIVDMEIICINDGSTDGTIDILKKLRNEDNRIVILDQDNQGLAFARNYGFDKAVGDYIYFLDSDDYLASSEILEKCINIMTDNCLDILIGGAETLFEDDKARLQLAEYENKYLIRNNYPDVYSGTELVYNLRKNNEWQVIVSLRLFKRQFLEDNNLRFSEGRIYEDVFFTYASNYLAKRAKIINDTIYIRRVRFGSTVTSQITHKNPLGYLRVFVDSLRFAEWNRND